MLGLHLASHYPARVRRLVAANCRYRSNEAGRQQWSERIQTVLEQGTAAIADGTLQRWFTPHFHNTQPNEVARMRAIIQGTSAQGYAAAAAAVRDLDLSSQLPGIRCPVLLITGDQDLAAPKDHMQEIASLVPQAQLHVLQHCAHISNMEHPQVFNALVEKHLGDPHGTPALRRP